MTAPLVSVVTAAYNARAGLAATIDSVAGQSFRDVEHVVVDGGSSDGTPDYLRGLGDSVRWISEPDTGIADAMNKGVEMARGTYVIVIHAEDTFLDADSLALAAAHLDGTTEIVSFDVSFATDSGPRRYESHGLTARLNFKTTIPHQGAFCRKALFERIGGFDTSLRIAMDYDFFLRAWRAGASAKRVPQMIARMPDTGVSSRLDWPSLTRRFAEERAIHARHCPHVGMRAVYAAYWPAYLAYRRMRAAIG